MPRATVLLIVVLGLLLVDGTPASAHPFGPPPVARLQASGRELTISWSAAEDDYTTLGGALGVLDAQQTFVYDADGQTVAGPPPTGEQLTRLAGSAQLREYLTEHVSVRQDGEDCALGVEASRLATEGVQFVAACPRPVADLEVRVTLLQDLHPAYRTVGLVDGAGTRTLFTESDPVRSLAFADAATSNAGWRTASAALVALVGAFVVGVVLRRRRTRRGRPSP